LFILAPCCFALLIGTPSSLSCAGGGAWSNTYKLHPTTKVFFPLISDVFVSLFCIFFIIFFIIFVLS
jgi:hypothetical protein